MFTHVSPLLEEGNVDDSSVASAYSQRLQVPRRLRGGEGEGVMVGAGVLIGILVFSTVYLKGCTAHVPPNHVGIQFNTFSKHVDTSRLYPAGRVWFSGPFLTYIVFPTNIQNVAMNLESRTSEGYPLQLKIEFQYQLMEDKILDLYEHYTNRYDPVFQRNVRAALMKSVSDYDAPDLFKKRQAILADMFYRVDNTLRESYAKCWGVQFDDVNQPPAFENTLLQTQLQKWYAETKIAEQKVSAITSNTSVLKAEFDKNISVVDSTATADVKYILSAAEANSKNYQKEAQANATLLTDRANARSSIVKREATAVAELKYQEAVAKGTAAVLTEKAQADMRNVQLQGLRLKYWKDIVGLSEEGIISFQRLLGSYKHLEDVKFLFGFDNTYATAEASPGTAGPAGTQSAMSSVQLAAIGGAAAGNAAAKAEHDHKDSRRLETDEQIALNEMLEL